MARLEGFRPLKLFELESFRALKSSRLENFVTLMYYGQIGVFEDPKILPIGEFKALKLSTLVEIN
jgi:hypothetical protein